MESLVEADAAITRHMDALADELTEILRTRVLAPYREQPKSEAEKARFEQTMARLRQLTMEAVVVRLPARGQPGDRAVACAAGGLRPGPSAALPGRHVRQRQVDQPLDRCPVVGVDGTAAQRRAQPVGGVVERRPELAAAP